jgi:hypothetical protein
MMKGRHSTFNIPGWERMTYMEKADTIVSCPYCGHRASVLEYEHWAGASRRGQQLDGVERPTDAVLNGNIKVPDF